VWQAGREFFDEHLDVTGKQLFAHLVQLTEQAGWKFPHETIDGDDIESYVAPGSHRPMCT
jgi:hypothetical protein